jgi:uncharacterized protein YecE (DUF72 family)
MEKIRIGISGWRYKGWRGVFYPEDLAQRRELEYASRQFPTIELNGSFYSLQRPSSYQSWYDVTPSDFRFTLKGGRYITHMRRLREVERPLANFFASGLLCLKEKLGPILWQFPPSFPYDEERMEAFFSLLPRDTEAAAELASRHDDKLTQERAWTKTDRKRPLRHAFEIRHKSFCDESFIHLLRKHKLALVFADAAGDWPYAEDVTADFIYIRLHGSEEIYASGYTERALDDWAAKIRSWHTGTEPPRAEKLTKLKPPRRKRRDVFVYFDNDAKVKAPGDAKSLIGKLGLTGGDA